VIIKFNDTVAKFIRTDGMSVIVNKGLVTVSGVPGQEENKVFSACGDASCSSIHPTGIDVNALKEKATDLGYDNKGRRGVGKAKQCTANQQHKAGKKDDGRFDNGEKSNSGG